MKSIKYGIPNEFHDELDTINSDIAGLAQKFRTSKTEIFELLTERALESARKGGILFPKRTRFLNIIETATGQIVSSSDIGPEKMKNEAKRTMSYKVSGNQPIIITDIAEQCRIPRGEVLMILLRHALEQYRAGEFTLVRHPRFVEVKEK
jgi:hypothetical protein